MQTFNSVAALQATLSTVKGQVGLVPTMGALHQGHLSLISRAITECDCVVVSVFVNPIQFNNKEDLAKYPRTLEADLQTIASVDDETKHILVLTPSVDEMYPDGTDNLPVYHYGQVEEVMEGPQRPGHFSGVGVVVRRLFDIVKCNELDTPLRAYFGEKDFQQIAVIRSLLQQIKYNVEIVPCPIVRADDGLALSSRNQRLSEAARNVAPTIYDTLVEAVEMSQYEDVESVAEWVIDTLSTFHEVNPIENDLRFEPEYFEIVNDTTLQPIEEWDECPGVVGCIAVWLDDVRLIDMVRFR